MGAVFCDPASVSRSLHFIVAEGRVQAELTAEIDWKWERHFQNGRKGWLTQEGQFVQYVSHTEQLYGLDKGTIIHLGYRWYANRDLRHLTEMAAARGYILVDGPK